MALSLPIGNEANLRDRYHNEISEFWRSGRFDRFLGKDQLEIHYCAFIGGANNKSLVIVPGRVEGYLKYKELAFDLFNQGYNIFIIDHRGQGISGRMLDNPHKGYVDSFDDYVDDLHTFISNIVVKQSPQRPYLLAHSMGGAIAARYLQRHASVIEAAVLSSPMISINSGIIPKGIAKFAVNLGHSFNKILGKPSWYFLGQGNYQAKPFEDNHLMQSDIRYTIFSQLYDEQSELKLGGVTLKWLREAQKVENAIFANLVAIKTPTTVIQAGAETIVDNHAQGIFCRQLNQLNSSCCPQGKPFVIENALHELFFEQDQYREPALQYALNWFAQHQGSQDKLN